MPQTANKGAQGNTHAAKSTYVIDMIMPAPMYDIFSTETPSLAVVKSNTGYQTLHTLFLLPSQNANPPGQQQPVQIKFPHWQKAHQPNQ